VSASSLVLVLLPAATLWCLFVRFLRWQFLLRVQGVRLPMRTGLGLYVVSVAAGLLTPFHLGELSRAAVLRARTGTPLAVTLPTMLVERLWDVAALASLVALSAMSGGLGWATLAALVALPVAGLAHRSVTPPTRGLPARLVRLVRPATLVTAFAVSLLAWAPVILTPFIAGAALHAPLPVAPGAEAYWRATRSGAQGVRPVAYDVRGEAFEAAGAPGLGRALAAGTTGVTVLAAVLVLLLAVIRGRRARRAADAAAHFDDIAGDYLKQFSSHIWQLLLKRRVDRLAAALGHRAYGRGWGVDLGCGLGQQGLALAARGYRVLGIDPAHGLVRQAYSAGLPVLTGSALALPLRDASVDFVYSIGVLHHLPEPAAQAAAFDEIARVLKPGGLLLVQETNTHNPVFTLYMTYLFPLLKAIDEGTEWWIPPDRWAAVPGFRCEAVRHFTFLPDFVPAGLLPPLLALERRLERGRWHRYSVHYQAELRRASGAAA
jgi:SAM-dependent methyltransferase